MGARRDRPVASGRPAALGSRPPATAAARRGARGHPGGRDLWRGAGAARPARRRPARPPAPRGRARSSARADEPPPHSGGGGRRGCGHRGIPRPGLPLRAGLPQPRPRPRPLRRHRPSPHRLAGRRGGPGGPHPGDRRAPRPALVLAGRRRDPGVGTPRARARRGRAGAGRAGGGPASGDGRAAPAAGRGGAAEDRPGAARRRRPPHVAHQRPGLGGAAPRRPPPGAGRGLAAGHQGREQGGAHRAARTHRGAARGRRPGTPRAGCLPGLAGGPRRAQPVCRSRRPPRPHRRAARAAGGRGAGGPPDRPGGDHQRRPACARGARRGRHRVCERPGDRPGGRRRTRGAVGRGRDRGQRDPRHAGTRRGSRREPRHRRVPPRRRPVVRPDPGRADAAARGDQ